MSTGSGRELGSRGALSRGPNSFSLNTYPNTFFDLSSQEIPRTIKEMFRWCLYLYVSHSEISALVNRKCSYIITDLVYDTPKKDVKNVWKELLEDTLDIQNFKFKMAVDLEVFGNAFFSILFPFERHLECYDCKERTSITDSKFQWKYRDFKFLGKCPKCKGRRSESMEGFQEFKVHDEYNKHKSAVRLVRWFPEYIKILRNPVTGKTRYMYNIPRHVKKEIQSDDPEHNKYLVEDMPKVFLDAIKDGRDVELDPSTFYSMQMPGVSFYDDSYGMPPLMHVFKDAWLFQTYRRAQEAIAIEHVLPLRLMIPRPISGDHSPHAHNNLGQWSFQMQTMVNRWRRDPNAFFTVPFPCEVQNIGGDAQALNVHNDLEQIRQHIAGGLGIPSDLIYGAGAAWSGTSISLRMLENTFLTAIKRIDHMVDKFIVPKMAAWLGLERISVKQRDFKMLDDSQQKQLALSLRQTNTISDRTVIQQLGFDYSEEQERKRAEEEDRNQTLLRQMVGQAEAQGRAQIVSARLEAQAQVAAQQAQEEAQRKKQLDEYDAASSNKGRIEMAGVAEAVGSPTPGDIGGSGIEMSDAIMDTLADRLIKTTPPEQMNDALMRASKKTPLLAAKVKQRMSQMQADKNIMRPLPEQRAPTRNQGSF